MFLGDTTVISYLCFTSRSTRATHGLAILGASEVFKICGNTFGYVEYSKKGE